LDENFDVFVMSKHRSKAYFIIRVKSPFVWTCGIWLLHGGWRNGQVWAELFEALLADAADDEEVFEAAVGAGFLTGADDGLGDRGADSGNLLELGGGGGVDVERFYGRGFELLGGSEEREKEQKRRTGDGETDWRRHVHRRSWRLTGGF
jgi:hypothetical protein